MSLEPERLVGHERVGRGVRLVEAVARELLHDIEDVAGKIACVLPLGRLAPLLHRAVHEYRAVLDHLLLDLLAHGAAEKVCAAQRIARELLGDLHYLLLVDDHAVGRLQRLLKAGVLVVRLRIGDLLEAVLSVDEVVDHSGVQGARAEERHERDDIVEAVRLELRDEVPHAGRLELEHCYSLAGEEVLEGVMIVKAD